MSNFNDLPIELLLMILNRLSPLDVDSFCQLTKCIREASQPFREKHLALKSRYTTCRNYQDGGFEHNGVLADLLRDIIEEPRRALYCRRLYIYGYMQSFEQAARYDDNIRRHLNYNKSTFKLFRDAISNCTMLPGSVKGDWTNAVEAGDEDPLIGLLLPMLPNLTKLRLKGCDAYFTTQMLEKISEKEGTEILAQLTAVEIKGCSPHMPSDYQCEDIGIINYFAVLPSVKRILALDACGGWVDDYAEIKPRNRKSSVTHVAFGRCSLCFGVLSEFLANAEALESFSYYAASPNVSREEFQPMWFRAALLAHVSETLVQLTILWCEEPKTLMGDLSNFKALRHLTTDIELLTDLSSRKMFQVVPLLPQTIRSVDVYAHCVLEPWHYLQIHKELMDSKAEKVPELSIVSYHFYCSNSKCDPFHGNAWLKGDMNSDLAAIGIQLSFTCNSQPYWEELFSEKEVEGFLGWAKSTP